MVNRLADRLEEVHELEQLTAEGVLRHARQIAAGHPTPQARMAAEGMGVRDGHILSLSGGTPGEVAAGSEFGSDIFLQFHRPHNRDGYWLGPAAEDLDPATIAAGEAWLDVQVEESLHGI